MKNAYECTQNARRELTGPDGPLKEKAQQWLKDLEEAYTQVCKVIDDYVTTRNAAANQARDAQVAADAQIAQQLHEAQQKVASAQAMATAASADHAASLLVIEKQKEVLKRRHDQEDAEIASVTNVWWRRCDGNDSYASQSKYLHRRSPRLANVHTDSQESVVHDNS